MKNERSGLWNIIGKEGGKRREEGGLTPNTCKLPLLLIYFVEKGLLTRCGDDYVLYFTQKVWCPLLPPYPYLSLFSLLLPLLAHICTIHTMSDPASTFLAAAFVAGIIEGSSVLRHHKNALQNNETPSSISIAAHSAFYGAVSLPLGLIGASPGVAFYPRAMKQPTLIDAQESPTAPVRSEDATRDIELGEATTMSSISSTPLSGTGRGIGRFLRDKNLRKSHYNHQAEMARPAAEQLSPGALQSEYSGTLKQYRMSRYVSTLDGSALPPVAEAMRRCRCLFIGAALASFGVTRYMHSRTKDESNVDVIIDEHGMLDLNHGMLLQKRLRADLESAKPKNDSYNNLHHKLNLSMSKIQNLGLSTICSVIKPVQQLVGSLNLPTLTRILEWQDEIATSIKEDNNPRPIAIRLVLNERNNIPSSSSIGTSSSSWPIKPENCVSDQCDKQPFFVLPIYFNHFKSKLWWELDSEQPLTELPLNSTWFMGNEEDINNQTLIIEANACPSIYDMVQHRYRAKGSNSNTKTNSTSYLIGSFTHMLLSLARTKCSDSNTIIATQSVLIHDNTTNEEKSYTNRCVWIDGSDVVKWTILSTINKTSEAEAELKGNDGDATSTVDSTQVMKRLTQYSLDKDVTTPWTIVDVVGTSIRHLLESTYRIASIVTHLVRQNATTRTSAKRVDSRTINIVSPSNDITSWLRNCLHGWKAKSIHTDQIADGEGLEGTTLVMGRDDLETCNLACAVMRQRKDQNMKLLLVLEDAANCEMIHSAINESDQKMVTIICTSLVYEHVFAIARSLLASGLSHTEVQAELESIVKLEGKEL